MENNKLLKQNADFLNLLRFYKNINKLELGKFLNLSMPTIYRTIDDLSDSGIINKDSLSICEDFGTLCGISIGSSLCKIVFLDMNFSAFSEEKFSSYKKILIEALLKSGLENDKLLSDCSSDVSKNYIYFKTPSNFSTLKAILDSVFNCIKLWHTDKALNFLSIGISCTGVINEQTHTILNAHILEYLNETTLTGLLFPDKQVFFRENNIDVYLVQNANAAMIAEKINLYQTNSQYKNNRNIMSLYLGGGIGAGLYFDKIYSGTYGYSGEIGHITAPYLYNSNIIDSNADDDEKLDRECTCGSKDCYEHRIRTDVFRKRHETFCDLSSSIIAEKLNNSPKRAEIFGSYLGHMINTCTNLLNLDLIIFTGKFYKSMDILFNHIVKVQDENHLKFSRNACSLIVSQLGPKAPAIGAAIYAYHMKYDLELSWEYYI